MARGDCQNRSGMALRALALTQREAERYLFENSADLSLVCGLAGINVGYLRRCLNKVRGRTLLDLVPAAI
jgi:hypothetical protein